MRKFLTIENEINISSAKWNAAYHCLGVITHNGIKRINALKEVFKIAYSQLIKIKKKRA